MILTFEIENVTEKEADDVADEVLRFIHNELELMVTDYEVQA